jgi:hypothetical protein
MSYAVPLSYTYFSPSVPALQASKGYFIVVSSVGAQLRVPGASDYCISKHAVNRLVEFIAVGEFGLLASIRKTSIDSEFRKNIRRSRRSRCIPARSIRNSRRKYVVSKGHLLNTMRPNFPPQQCYTLLLGVWTGLMGGKLSPKHFRASTSGKLCIAGIYPRTGTWVKSRER